MKRVWAELSPWLDIPMNQRHWQLLCAFALASTPLGFGLGQLARRHHERPEVVASDPEIQLHPLVPDSSSEELLRGGRAVGKNLDADERIVGSLAASEAAAMVAVPAGLGWLASIVLFPPRS